jgi:pectate lyase
MAENLAHGFASMNGGTTGGSGGPSVTVSTGAALQAAIDKATGPLTIYVDGQITTANSGVDVISIAGKSNISVIGVGTNADFDGIGIRVSAGSSNLIIQNLKIHNVATGPKDAIGIEGDSKNVWVDHNELYSSLAADKDYYDGLLDIKRGAEYITISNNYLHDHHKTSLVGYSDEDAGGRFITYDHNVFENIGSRAPSVRDGDVHIYDNYYKNIETSGINLRMGAVGLVENNVFENAHNPIVSLDSAKIGYWDLSGNVMTDVTWSKPGSNEASAENGVSTASYDVPYAYTLDAAASVPGLDRAQAGIGHLGAATPVPVTPDPVPHDPVTPTPVTPVPVPPTHEPSPTPVETSPSHAGTAHADSLDGTAGDDRIDALQGHDIVHGHDGNDVLIGGEGRDTLFGDAGNDTLDGGNGNDALSGGAGDDHLIGGNGSDTLDGGDGNDILDGGASHDVLTGGAGNDRLDGGSNADDMAGGTGDDTYVVDIKRDVVVELTGEGNDTVESATSYKLGDNVENLILTGSSDNSATGNALDNILMGNAGNNRIDGGAGNDGMTGGGGHDTYVFTRGEGGQDVIHDFTLGSDTLDFHGYHAADATLTDSSAGTTLHLPGETILLEGVHLKAITGDWAHFA